MPTSVAIVIPSHNHAHFLGEALESALAQSHALREVIVVDDGSSDDPGAVTAQFPDVRLIRQGHSGLATARNTGWRAARGEFIVFLDADDRLLPDALASNLRVLRDQPECAFVYGGYRIIDVEGRITWADAPQSTGADAYEALLRGNCIGMHATVMYRRNTLAEIGGFDERLRACEDYDVFLRLAAGHRVAFNPECLAEYRIHDRNMSGNVPLMLHSALRVLHKQRANASHAPTWVAAYQQGRRSWKEYFIDIQISRAWQALRKQELTPALIISLIRVLGLGPNTFLRMTLRRFQVRRKRKRVCTADSQ